MKVARRNQKYCSGCRLGRQAAMHRGQPETCPGCGQDFIDWSQPFGNRTSTAMCGTCLLAYAPGGGRESVPGTCGWQAKGTCHSDTETVVYSETVKLCFPCLTDPKKFIDNRAAIIKRHRGLTAPPTSATVDVGQDRPAGAEQETE